MKARVNLFEFEKRLKVMLSKGRVFKNGTREVVSVKAGIWNTSQWMEISIDDPNFKEKVAGQEGVFSDDGNTFRCCRGCVGNDLVIKYVDGEEVFFLKDWDGLPFIESNIPIMIGNATNPDYLAFAKMDGSDYAVSDEFKLK